MVMAGTVIVVAVLTLDVYAHVGGLDPLATTYQYLSPPNLAHVMGTDQLGRDLLARVSIGTTFSLLVAFISVIISVGVGCIIGGISGFFGGKIDRAISLAFDALYALPPLIIAILIAAMIGAGIVNTGVAIAVGYMPQYFRIVRGIIFSIKERPFIESTRAIGAGYVSLIFRHMMPYAIPSIIALMTLNMGSGIVDVSGLGFLGLGLPPPTPEWGTDLGRGRDFITSGAWWPSTFPGLMIVISVLGFTLVGEGLDEVFRATSTRQKEKF
jgi:peptide/nickel transport system permease protein